MFLSLAGMVIHYIPPLFNPASHIASRVTRTLIRRNIRHALRLHKGRIQQVIGREYFKVVLM